MRVGARRSALHRRGAGRARGACVERPDLSRGFDSRSPSAGPRAIGTKTSFSDPARTVEEDVDRRLLRERRGSAPNTRRALPRRARSQWLVSRVLSGSALSLERRGSSTTNRVRFFSLDSTRIVPPCVTTICRLMYNPSRSPLRPAPPGMRLDPLPVMLARIVLVLGLVSHAGALPRGPTRRATRRAPASRVA